MSQIKIPKELNNTYLSKSMSWPVEFSSSCKKTYFSRELKS